MTAVAIAAAVVSSVVRTFLACRYYGFQNGDDAEVVAETFRRALGVVHSPWDIRSLLIPDVILAPIVHCAHRIGISNVLALAMAVRVPFLVLSAVNVLLVFTLGRRWYGPREGAIAAVLYAAHWIPLVYGSTSELRTFAVTCVLIATILVSDGASVPRTVFAGVLAAFAMTTRYSEAVCIVSLALFIWFSRQPFKARMTVALLSGFAIGFVVFVGLYDYLTWGQWFGSLAQFAKLTFIRRQASSQVAVHMPWWYFANILHWIPATVLVGFIVATRRSEARRAFAFVGFPVLALSAVFHKELRYLQIIVPFVLLIAAHGFVVWLDASVTRRRLAIALMLISIPLGLSHIGQVAKRSTNAVATALSIGQRGGGTIALSQVWAYGGSIFLGNSVEIAELELPPRLDRVRELSGRSDILAMYSDDINTTIVGICEQNGLKQSDSFQGLGGPDVTVFRRAASDDRHPD